MIFNQYDEQIVKLYQDGYYMRQIGKILHISGAVVKRILNKYNIPMHTRYKKYAIMENFFDNIDTEEKSYILGFLFADAYIDKYNIALTLSEKDKEILTKIVKAIYLTNEYHIRTYRSKQPPYKLYSNINFSSMYMAEKLNKLGCVRAKSLILTFPPLNIADEIICRHFIRGYFDGDGGFVKKAKSATITSTLAFCERAQEIIELYTGVHMHVYKYKNVYRLTIHGRNLLLKVFNWIYKDATIFLQRKFDIYNDILSEKTNYFSEEEILAFISLWQTGMSYRKIAKIYDCSETGVRKAIKRANI